MPRVVLAMSGGVDSSAAAVLLREAGYDVIGLFMRSGAAEDSACALPGTSTALSLPQAKPNKQGCCSAADAADARRVADRLDIPFHAINFQDAFGRIKDYFADEYLAGRTPNPCVMCNNWLKFGRLWDFAQQVGADFIASGHYAQIVPTPIALSADTSSANGASAVDESMSVAEGSHASPTVRRSTAAVENHDYALTRGADRSKDQSYVLFGIRRDLLPRILFPVGGRTKTEIRELARQTGLRVADKPDSQEICFIPDHDYVGFVRRHRQGSLPDTSGEFVDPSGRVLGHHDGYEKFTVGQRKGLGIAFGEPRYVVAVEPQTARVVVGTRAELARKTLIADRANWLVAPPPDPLHCTAQIRYRHTAAAATVTPLKDNRIRVTFDEPQYGVAPGQAVVLYSGDRVLGGAWIQESEPT